MKKITVAPLSTPLTLTNNAWQRIVSAKNLFVLSAMHPCAKPIIDAGLSFVSMDNMFEAAEDFDELWELIADRLLASDDCTIAVTGVADALLSALERKSAGVANVEVLASVPIALAAFPSESSAARVCANALPERLDASQSLLIEELDSRLLAGEVKLRLSEYYPDEWQVTLAHMNADGTFTRETIPLNMLDRKKKYDAVTVLFVPATTFDDRTRYGFSDLVNVLIRLRAPDGCPWDREQTHASIKESLLEECYEAMDAIDREDDDGMTEELGDVLMQIALHAVIAAEQGRFTDRDITTELVRKLVYRHPHVFGSHKVNTSQEVLENWDALKKVEKQQSTQTEVLRSVPKNFPALLRSRKVQKRAASVGFDWNSAEDAFFKIIEETEELHLAMQQGSNVDEELGDLLFSVVNVARLLHLEPEFSLAAATEKFIDRFERMENLAISEGKQLEQMTLAEQDRLWDHVKAVKI